MIESNRSAVSLIALAALAVVVGCGGGGSYKAARSAPATSGGYSGGGYASPAAESAPSGGDYAGSSSGSGGSPGTYAPPPAAAPGGGYAPTSPAPTMADKSSSKKAEGAPSMPMPPITIETKTTVTVTPTPYPPPGVIEDQSPTGGVLTAAIWDDHAFRPQFNTFLARYPSFANQWGIDMTKRVTVRVEDQKGVLVGDVPIALRAPDGSVVNLRTHADGTTYFWPTASMLGYNQGQGGTFAIAAQAGKLRKEAWFTAPTTDTTWTLRLDGIPTRAQAPALDVAFVVDCTGSMGDEIAYLQHEISGVVKRAKAEHAMRRVRLGLVLYRDRGDEFVSKSFGFTEDLGTYLTWLKTAQAMGGGDMPESVNAALADTVQKLDWAGDETGRLAFLVADAPPHYYADEQYTYKNAIVDLNARGVKLVSVGASGIDKSTEYVFRQMSAYTGGRYVFLTDDSGVGDSHLIPDISNYQVEHLDKILVRAIADEARAFKR